MPHIEGTPRFQIQILAMEDLVSSDSIARIIDSFVNGLELSKFNFKKAIPSSDGRPSYSPSDLLKLLIYGNCSNIRSSRKLAQACKINVEVMWLLNQLTPDFRTISDFRKNNIDCMKSVFHEYNKLIASSIPSGFKSVDGSKFYAYNSKDNNFTTSKLDDRIKNLDEHVEEYMKQLAYYDKEDAFYDDPTALSKEEIQHKLNECIERKTQYEEYLNTLEKTGQSQISLTDPDSKLMKNKNGFAVAHNIQTAVDSESHIIENFVTTSNPTDHGQLFPTLNELKSENQILDSAADKGYQEPKDMVNCLENGIIPNVISNNGKPYTLETDYEENQISEAEIYSNDPKDITKCLRAGVIPNVYKNQITNISITEKKVSIISTVPIQNLKEESEFIQKASEGFFVRDLDRNIVYCPAGQKLRQKSIKKNGNIRYYNSLACSKCKHKDICCKGKNKEIDFADKIIEKPCRWKSCSTKSNNKIKREYTTKKIVTFTFKVDLNKTTKRMCISEHPFGTIKRWMNGYYFLLRGSKKVNGEFSMLALAYNIKRSLSLLSTNNLKKLLTIQ